jgi:hypothetical protein
MNLSQGVKITKVAAAGASAGTAVNSSSVDMSGFEGVIFIGSLATANAGNSAVAAQSSDNSAFADLSGASVVTGDDADSFLIDVYRPRERYVRVELDRSGANTAYGDIYAVQYKAAKSPTTHGATIDSVLAISPAEA